jgi:hypothetical protein
MRRVEDVLFHDETAEDVLAMRRVQDVLVHVETFDA